MATFDRDFFGCDEKIITREAVEAKLAIYATQQSLGGVPRHSIMRHTLGLYRGLPGARAWRRSMSQQPVWAA
jgi:tRNA-dihydrouridine synthase A